MTAARLQITLSWYTYSMFMFIRITCRRVTYPSICSNISSMHYVYKHVFICANICTCKQRMHEYQKLSVNDDYMKYNGYPADNISEPFVLLFQSKIIIQNVMRIRRTTNAGIRYMDVLFYPVNKILRIYLDVRYPDTYCLYRTSKNDLLPKYLPRFYLEIEYLYQSVSAVPSLLTGTGIYQSGL